MKNILIITIGTRDVQLTEAALSQAENTGLLQRNPNPTLRNVVDLAWSDSENPVQIRTNPGFDQYYLPNVPRKDGETFLTDSRWMALLAFPLIEAPLEWLQQEVKVIDQVLTVYTDQTGKEVAEHHLNNDTLHFNTLVHKFLQKHPVTHNAYFDEYCISDEVTNIDYQYNHFEQEKQNFLSVNPSEVSHVFLLAQGGIDQINMALTLRLIEHFPGKVRYLHKAEEARTLERDFPTLFIKNLIWGKAKIPLERYEFGTIETLVDNPIIKHLARLGLALRSLDIERVKSAFVDLFRQGYDGAELKTKSVKINNQADELFKQELIFLNVLVELELEDYNEALWRLRTLGEIVQASRVEQKLGHSITDIKERSKLINAIKQYKNLTQKLNNRTFNQESKWVTDSAFAPIAHAELYPNLSSPLKECLMHNEKIRELRNQLIHSAKPVSKLDIDAKTSIRQMETDWRNYFKVSSGKGIFDTIRDEIEKLL
jgi:hypothetical protein